MDQLAILAEEQALKNLDGDKELLAEIRLTFVETGDEILSVLSSGDLESSELLRTIHSLKSSAGSIGAEKLAFIAKNAEKLFRDGSFDALGVALPELVSCLNQTLFELKNGTGS